MTFFVEALSKHLEPEAQVRRIGEYKTVAEAIAVAQQIVDAFLQREYKPGMDAKALFTLYQTQGEHPFIFRDDGQTLNVPGFNHTHYAMTRAEEICAAPHVKPITAGTRSTMHKLTDFRKEAILNWLAEHESFAERLQYRTENDPVRRLALSILRCIGEMRDELASYEQPEARRRQLLLESISKWRKEHPGHYEPPQDVRRDLYADAEMRAFREAFPDLAKIADEIAEMRTRAETGVKC